MAEAQDTLDVSDLKENFLECSVCLEHFDQTERRPRLLVNCFHAFCTQCLEQLLEKEGRGQVTCPNCRQVQEIKGDAQSLPVDLVRNKLVDYVQFKKNKKIPCTDCPDGGNAVVRCHECKINMCTRCKEAHHRNRPTRKHICQSLEDALSEPIKSFLSHFCKDHPDHKIEFYCGQCSSPCCVSCSIVKHKGHDLDPLEDAANSMLSSLKTKMKDVEKSTSVLRRRKASLEKDSSQQEFNLKQTTLSINQTFEKLFGQLKIRQKELITELQQRTESAVNGLKKQREATEDSLAQLESAMEYFKQMESKSDDCEVLSAGPVLVKSLESTADVDQIQDVQHPTLTFLHGEMNNIIFKVQTFGGIHSSTDRHSKSRDIDMTTARGKYPIFAALEFEGPFGGRNLGLSKGRDMKYSSFTSTFPETASLLRDLDKAPNEELEAIEKWIIQTTGNPSGAPVPTRMRRERQIVRRNEDEVRCPICIHPITDCRQLDKCGHAFCNECIRQAFKQRPVCPVCGMLYGTVTGNQPRGGRMSYQTLTDVQVPGYKDARGAISIEYYFPGGFQEDNHPNPGKRYAGIRTTAYLPNNTEGWEVLRLLEIAFKAGLVFTIGKDLLTGHQGKIIWNDFDHKTNVIGGPENYGYPDADYLRSVKYELATKGITGSHLPE